MTEVLCIRCKQPIPEGRLKILPGTKTCVNCSTTQMKRAITITTEEGEDTYTQIVVVDAEVYNKYCPPSDRGDDIEDAST
jgi:hypothetical protein